MQLEDKVAVVTGGASGLGRATAKMMREAGGRVALFDMNEELGQKYASAFGAEATAFHQVDVADAEAVEAAVQAVVDRFGRIDICVNCAGIANPGKILDREGKAKPLAAYEAVLRVNLLGSFNVMRVCAEHMARNELDARGERGVVVNVASAAAFDGQIGQSAYSSSKGGIVSLSLPAARELGAFGIRVNAIAPGLFRTEMAESLGEKVLEAIVETIEAPRRMGDPAEFAHAVRFLVENAYMNGECVRLDAATRLRAR